MPAYKEKSAKKNPWYYHFEHIQPDGRIKMIKKRGFAKKKDAQKAEEERKRSLEQQPVHVLSTDYNGAYEEYLLITAPTVKPDTIEKKKQIFRDYITPYFENVKFEDYNLKLFQLWQAEMYKKKNNKNATNSAKHLNLIKTELLAFCKHLAENEYIKKNYAELLKPFKDVYMKKEEMKVYDMDDFAIFYSVINDEMFKLAFLTFFTMGLRCGELQGLQFRDLDFENKKLSVDRSINYRGKGGGFVINPPKANSYRTIDMPDILVEPLKRWCDYHKQVFGYNEKRYVFGFDKPLHHNSITQRKDSYTKEAQQLALYQNIKLERIRLHDFRHSHITMLLKNIEGIDQIRLVSERAGHKNVSETIDTYGHVLKRVDFDLLSSYNHLKQDFLIPQVDVYKKMLESNKDYKSGLPQISNHTKKLHLEKSIFDEDDNEEKINNKINNKIKNKL